MSFYITYLITLYGMLLSFSVVAYILTGKSLSAIARRRGIEKPWLAWVPVGSDWLLGCISDQYRYVVHGQERNARGKLMRWIIIMLSMTMIVSILAGVLVVMETAGASDQAILALALLLLLIAYGMVAIAVVYSVAYYKALFDLFRSCDPDKTLVFLLVSIFTSYPGPVFLYICRDKDLGMPPRQDAQQLPETE